MRFYFFICLHSFLNIKTESELQKRLEMEQKLRAEMTELKARLERLETEKLQKQRLEKENFEMEQKLNDLKSRFEQQKRDANNANEMNNAPNAKTILREWNLSQYIKVLIIDEGYEEIEDWKDLSIAELKEMGFKTGHAKMFQRKYKEYFQQRRGANNQNQNENDDNEQNEGIDGTFYK